MLLLFNRSIFLQERLVVDKTINRFCFVFALILRALLRLGNCDNVVIRKFLLSSIQVDHFIILVCRSYHHLASDDFISSGYIRRSRSFRASYKIMPLTSATLIAVFDFGNKKRLECHLLWFKFSLLLLFLVL
jgi:hypothetical protein